MKVPSNVLRVGLRALRPLVTSDRLTLASKRRIVEIIAGASPIPNGIAIRSATLAGVPVERIIPSNALRDSAILLLHGGGYASGSARGYRGLAGALAGAAGMEVVVADYRLAPEHPFPAALDDALSVYSALLHEVTTVAVAGDSAGGGLTLAAAQRIRDASLPMPAALGLICPWLDLAVDNAASRSPGRDPIIVPSLTAEWCTFYLGGHDPREPGISPIHGNLASLPPIVMHSAGDDPLCADADALERKMASESRGLLIHRRYANRWHDFHLQVGFFADADHAVALFGGQLAEIIGSRSIEERHLSP